MFENVNYTFYSETLGRSVIPSEEVFNALKLENELEFKNQFLPYVVEELEENGIDSAVCLMIEKTFESENIPDESAVASESTQGHSVSYDMNLKAKDHKSLEEKKLSAVKLFCRLRVGV